MKRALAILLLLPACSAPPAPKPSGPQPNVTFSIEANVPSGGEIFQCKFVTMPAIDQYIIGAEHHYTPGSHHMLLYRTDLTTIPAGGDQPQDCYEGEGGTIMSHVRGVIYGSQVPDGSLTMPAGVGFHAQPGEVLLLQAHYLNATPKPLDAQVNVGLFTTTDKSKIQNEAGVLFYYDPFIDVPAGQKATAGARCTLKQDITLVTVFPHYHRRGYGYQAYLDQPGQAPSTMPFYTSTDWEHPAPWTGGPMTIKAGSAIRFYCDYDNTMGTQEYLQGPSASNNEMCMFTGMYYPAMDTAAEFCEHDFDQFGTGKASCATTSTCLQACPPGSAPTGLSAGGNGEVSACWQRCFAASCPGASAPLFDQLNCISTNCATECSGSGSDCTSCAINKCPDQVSACQSQSC